MLLKLFLLLDTWKRHHSGQAAYRKVLLKGKVPSFCLQGFPAPLDVREDLLQVTTQMSFGRGSRPMHVDNGAQNVACRPVPDDVDGLCC